MRCEVSGGVQASEGVVAVTDPQLRAGEVDEVLGDADLRDPFGVGHLQARAHRLQGT